MTAASKKAAAVAVGLGIVLLALAVYLHRHEPVTGDVLWGRGPASLDSGSAVPGLQDAVDATADAYYEFIRLGTLLFAAVGFFVTHRRESGKVLPPGGALPLVLTLVLGAGVVGFALLGVDRLLEMVGNNAVDLAFPGLRWGRLGMYVCWVLALVSLGVFVLQLLSDEIPDRSARSGSQD